MIEWQWVGSVHQASSDAESSGSATVRFGPVPAGYMWAIERVVVHTTSTGTPEVRLHRNQISNLQLVDGTDAIFNVADNHQPIRLNQNESLVIEWTSLSTGAICTATLQIGLHEAVKPSGPSIHERLIPAFDETDPVVVE